MRRIEKVGFLIFLIGFGLKFIHAPFHTVIMLVGIISLLGIYLYFLFSKGKSVEYVLSGLCAVSWLIFLLFVIKFFPFVYFSLALAVCLTLLWLIRKIKFKEKSGSITALNIAIIAFCSALYLIAPSTRYRIFNILYNKEIETDFQTWDKYSWFLYRSQKFNESYEASIKAQNALLNFQLKHPEESLNVWQNQITQHQIKIREKNWSSYR